MNYTILPAAPGHLPYLPGIEDAAGELFPMEDLPEPVRSISLLPEDFEVAQKNELLWVVVDESNLPVAFLLASIVDGDFHIAELDVHPRHGRKGIGSQLLHYVLAVAGQRGFRAATLTTFEHLPWNGPYYARHGFEILKTAEIEKELAKILEEEAALGMKRRVAMKAKLGTYRSFEVPRSFTRM